MATSGASTSAAAQDHWGAATGIRVAAITLLAGVYGWAVLDHPYLQHPSPLELFTALMALHALAYWLWPRRPVGRPQVVVYLALQAVLVGGLGSAVRDAPVTAVLTLALCAEALLAARGDWRLGAPAVAGVLVIFALTLTVARTAHIVPALLLVAAGLPCLAVAGSVLTGQARAFERSRAALRELEAVAERERARAGERQRMARDLHDTLAQGVAGLVLQLEAVAAQLELGNERRAREIVAGALERARSTLGEARRAIDGLRAEAVGGLAQLVDQETGRFRGLSDAECTVEVHGDGPLTDLQEEQVRHLLREAIGNVARHARARHVCVRAGMDAFGLRVEVADDGRGFDPLAAAPGRYGLRGLRERAELAGGELEIVSAPEVGTTIRLRIPAHGPRTVTAERRPVRVLIADDHLVVREGLRLLLESTDEFELVGAATDGESALRLAATCAPDVALLDLRMPGLDGVGTMQRLRREVPDVAVVVLTTYDEDDLLRRSLEARARGFLLKDTTREVLFRTLRAAARGETLLQPWVAARALTGASGVGRLSPPQLTDRELEVLRLAAEGGRNKEIARRLGITERTVKAHLASVFGKLGVDSRAAAVARAIEDGILRDAGRPEAG